VTAQALAIDKVGRAASSVGFFNHVINRLALHGSGGAPSRGVLAVGDLAKDKRRSWTVIPAVARLSPTRCIGAGGHSHPPRKPVSTLDLDPGRSLCPGRPKAKPGSRDDEGTALLTPTKPNLMHSHQVQVPKQSLQRS